VKTGRSLRDREELESWTTADLRCGLAWAARCSVVPEPRLWLFRALERMKLCTSVPVLLSMSMFCVNAFMLPGAASLSIAPMRGGSSFQPTKTAAGASGKPQHLEGGTDGEAPLASEVRFGRGESTQRLYYNAGTNNRDLQVATSSASQFSSPAAHASRAGHLRGLVEAVWARLVSIFCATFLPAGFPSSVPPEYLRYQSWNVVQDLSSSMRGVLCTQKLLEGAPLFLSCC
jgi:hypothetical protein